MKKLLALIVMLLAVVPVAMAEDPLEVYSITDIDITTVRSDYEYGWEIIAGTNDTAWYVYGKTNDSADVFIPDWYTDTSYLSVIINGIEQTPAVTAGDTVTFTYLTESGGGEQDVIVRCPAIAVDDYRFYVGTTGSAFSDAACLVKISDVTPTPSVTPTAAATATAVIPTATPSLTPAASATPTPVTADIWYQVGDSIYPATAGTDLDLSGDMSVQSTVTITGKVSVISSINYAGVSASTTANTYILDPTPNLVVTAPILGQMITWKSDTAGDGASTVSVDGVADTLQDREGNPTAASDIIVDGMVIMIFDGTNWRLEGI